jgi:hypothetical protein
MHRTIAAEEIVEAADHLVKRVHADLPESGLARVAEEIREVARETEERCRIISRPNLTLHLVAVMLIALALTFAIVQVFESLMSGVVFFAAVTALLVSQEMRRKRGHAAIAINELRALGYMVDRHQLSRDPKTGNHDFSGEMLALVSRIADLYVQSSRLRSGWRGRDRGLHSATAAGLVPTPHRS